MNMTTDTIPSLPAGTRVRMTVWSIRCKYFSDGTRNKYKARLCANDGMDLSLEDKKNKKIKEADGLGKERARSLRVGKK